MLILNPTDQNGRLRILPAEIWAMTTVKERALIGSIYGLYSFPTMELVEALRTVIDGRSAIEIGAGNGILAEALDIPATDNRMQELPQYRTVYDRLGQSIVPYGPNIIECDAHEAVRRFKPQVVIASWVTHKYKPSRHWAGGNEVGVDEVDVIANCETYVVIGNEKVHKDKEIWDLPHTIDYPPWLYSRAHNGSPDFFAVWE